jgi:hypothetical protein
MQLDKLLSAADPARQAQLDDAESPRAVALYRRIVGTPPSLGGGGVPTSVPDDAEFRAPARPQRRPLTRRLSALAAVAAAVLGAAVSLVVMAGSSPAPRNTLAGNTLAGGSGKAIAGTRSSVSPRRSSHSQPVRLNQAGVVLDALATVAAGRSPTSLAPGPGNYLYVLDIELKGAPPGGGTSMPCGSVIRQQWLASDNSGRQVINQPGCAQESQIVQSWGRGGNGINFDYLGWEGLPTVPAAMEAAIVQRFEGGKANNVITFQLATTVLNVAAPPAVRAALFRMLATLPGVRYLGKVTDPLGRTGDTIALVKKPDDIVAMFDPKTSQVLDALLTPHGIHIPRRMPTWDTPELFVETAVVGSSKATPPGTKKLLAEIPYRHWVW